MSGPAAKLGDKVVGTDTHVVLVPSAGGPVPTPTQMPFNGVITSGCSTDVLIAGAGAAVVGAEAVNTPPHVPPGSATFSVPPSNRATLIAGSATVLINGKPAVRAGDKALTCNDPAPLPTGTVVATGTVIIGG